MTAFQISDDWIIKALSWADQHFDHFSYHQNNDIAYPHQGFEHLLAIGAKKVINPRKDHFDTLAQAWLNNWLFGYLGYDLKDQLNDLKSKNPDPLQFPDLYFFEPLHLLAFNEGQVIIHTEDLSIWEQINAHEVPTGESTFDQPTLDFDQLSYSTVVNQLIDHIIEGDCYEINFCQGFYGAYESIDLAAIYWQLNSLSPKPFSCIQKLNQHAIICASPERFLKKEGQQLISQPIKGTRPRSLDREEDDRLKVELRNDEKELAENMMIVDLVRNDLARSSISGSVKVEEMFGIYSFEHVHQMISTITSTLKEGISAIEAIKNAFPMGSMTGAPKLKVMELIEQYEKSKRGAFSGASGYLKPNGDFDLNVLIRSLFINQATKNYGFEVGSAITYDAKAESEYEECFVKAKAILQLLNQ